MKRNFHLPLILFLILVVRAGASDTHARSYLLTGSIGSKYYETNTGEEELELFTELNLRGSIWDPRFMKFSTGVFYSTWDTGDSGLDSLDHLGFRALADFFQSKRTPFSIYYLLSEYDRGEGGDSTVEDLGARFKLKLKRPWPTLGFTVGRTESEDMGVKIKERSYREFFVDKRLTRGGIHLDYLKEETDLLVERTERIRREIRLDGTKRFGTDHLVILRGVGRRYESTYDGREAPVSENMGLDLNTSHHVTDRLGLSSWYSYSNYRYTPDSESNIQSVSARGTWNARKYFSYYLSGAYRTAEEEDAAGTVIEESATSAGGGLSYGRNLARGYFSGRAGLNVVEDESNIRDGTSNVSRYLSLSYSKWISRKTHFNSRYEYSSLVNDVIEEHFGFAPGDPGRYTIVEDGIERDLHYLNLDMDFRQLRKYPIGVNLHLRRNETAYKTASTSETTSYGLSTDVRNRIWGFQAGYIIKNSKSAANETDSTHYRFMGNIQPIRSMDVRLIYRKQDREFSYYENEGTEDYELKATYKVGRFFVDFRYFRRSRTDGVDSTFDSYYISVRRNFIRRMFW